MKTKDGGRAQIITALKQELVGPSESEEGEPLGKPLSTSPPPHFDNWQEVEGPYWEAESGQEILMRVRPTKRYGVGVLYPQGQSFEDGNASDEDDGAADPSLVDQQNRDVPQHEGAGSGAGGQDLDGDDFDLSATSQYRPSAMAVSFLAEMQEGDVLRVVASGGRYEPLPVQVGTWKGEWFARRPVTLTADFAFAHDGRQVPSAVQSEVGPLLLELEAITRRKGSAWLVTVALVNKAEAHESAEAMSLFQSQFKVTLLREGERVAGILPYPESRSSMLLERDKESRSLDLLYRNAPTFGVGHGCAATWGEEWGEVRSSQVTAEPLPIFEAPSVTPEITLKDGSALSVPIGPLAGLSKSDSGFDAMELLIESYSDWIADLEEDAAGLSGYREVAAQEHLEHCRRARNRMQSGLHWLRDDPTARRAFELANRAILDQRLQYLPNARPSRLTKHGIEVEPRPEAVPSWQEAGVSWRPFQIGFLLAACRSVALEDDPDRMTAELIFFPTGGGKTEAYLGLAAFMLFYDRLMQRGAGVSVLMRYTLRLLTSQQFLRSAALICAMERLRRSSDDLGDEPFSIGIWVGSSTTPNNRTQAVEAFRKLAKGGDENPFLLLRCPWCYAQMGPVQAEKGVPAQQPRVAGYREASGTIKFRCPDRDCEFRRDLPVYVVDEDVYDAQPSIVIGTVDKFAMLAFRPEARSLFGLAQDGSRSVPPPGLIIQDELHLIAGPLGSMVGLYEPIIEALCTAGGDHAVLPKIVGSTATIRNYQEQIRQLYGRDRAALFPPPGLDASDSFFARFATRPAEGEAGAEVLDQGRAYVGVHAPGLGSIQTAQVRVGAALLQAADDLPDQDKDPWWTSLMFFNSIRELGTSVSLLQSDIPDYLYTMRRRRGAQEQRYINSTMELTSRLRHNEIPGALDRLENTFASGEAVDACLASNIIEVGVDIQRLSLLTVLGQPKSTSTYIQISGRVGRNWQERPGLVVTLYSPLRPRDRSHYEQFQSYHQRLYAAVEPVSVTPFSAPVLERAVHAAVVAFIRQVTPLGSDPRPLPLAAFEEAARILEERVAIAGDSVELLERELSSRLQEWDAWEPFDWEPPFWDREGEEPEGFLLRRAGAWVPQRMRDLSWATPMSMRDVDAECRAAVTTRFAAGKGTVAPGEGNPS